jgi:hypothetical protein
LHAYQPVAVSRGGGVDTKCVLLFIRVGDVHAGVFTEVPVMLNSIEEFVARENIRRFQEQIVATNDDNERSLLLRMLIEESDKLMASRTDGQAT